MAEEQCHDPELAQVQQTSTSMELQATPLQLPEEPSSVMSSLEYQGYLSPANFDILCLIHFIYFPIQASVAHSDSLSTTMSGPISMLMYANGHKPV